MGLQLTEDRLGLHVGENDGDVAMAFGANHPVELAKFAAEYVSVEEQESIKGLVLRGGGHPLAHSQVGQEAVNLLGSEIGGGSAADETLKLGNPEAIGLQGPGGIWGTVGPASGGGQAQFREETSLHLGTAGASDGADEANGIHPLPGTVGLSCRRIDRPV